MLRSAPYRPVSRLSADRADAAVIPSSDGLAVPEMRQRQRSICPYLSMRAVLRSQSGHTREVAGLPIKPENAKRYPKDWNDIRARILRRAGDKCEWCGVENYALGGRTRDGIWLPAFPLGERALRLEWPKPGTRAYCGYEVGVVDGKRHYVGEECRIIRIVLTIAHLDHKPENSADDNLKALCQRCHLRYDHDHHQRNAYATRRAGKAKADMFEAEGR